MSDDLLQDWLIERNIDDVEAIVPDILGDAFVDLYVALKDDEYREFQEIITPYEREILMFNV